MTLDDLLSPLNGIIMALLRSRLHFVASKNLMIVGWSGRKTGRTFSIPVGYQLDGDAVIVLISKRDDKRWWKNFKSPWPADLQIRGKLRSTMGEVVPVGTPEFFEHCEQTLQRFPSMGSQFGGFRYDPASGLDDEQRKVLCEHVGAVRFEFVG